MIYVDEASAVFGELDDSKPRCMQQKSTILQLSSIKASLILESALSISKRVYRTASKGINGTVLFICKEIQSFISPAFFVPIYGSLPGLSPLLILGSFSFARHGHLSPLILTICLSIVDIDAIFISVSGKKLLADCKKICNTIKSNIGICKSVHINIDVLLFEIEDRVRQLCDNKFVGVHFHEDCLAENVKQTLDNICIILELVHSRFFKSIVRRDLMLLHRVKRELEFCLYVISEVRERTFITTANAKFIPKYHQEASDDGYANVVPKTLSDCETVQFVESENSHFNTNSLIQFPENGKLHTCDDIDENCENMVSVYLNRAKTNNSDEDIRSCLKRVLQK